MNHVHSYYTSTTAKTSLVDYYSCVIILANSKNVVLVKTLCGRLIKCIYSSISSHCMNSFFIKYA